MARTIVNPAAARATLPTYMKSGLVDREAPPNPVCGAPGGTTAATVARPEPVPLATPDPAAPAPLPPAPPPVVPPTPGLEPVPGVAVGPTVVVVVDVGVTKLLVYVLVQVTALTPPVAVPLHWLTVTGNADAAPVTVQPTAGCPA